MEMKVVNVDFVENEMVELDVVQIGQIEVESEDECGDGHAKETSPAALETSPAALLPNPLHPPNNTPNNQSKPIVPIPSLSLL